MLTLELVKCLAQFAARLVTPVCLTEVVAGSSGGPLPASPMGTGDGGLRDRTHAARVQIGG